MRRSAVRLVARRELTERVRERSFLVGTCVSIAIIALVVVLPPLLGLDEQDRYTVGAVGEQAAKVAEAARAGAGAFDAEITVRRVEPDGADTELRDGELDAVLTDDVLRSREKPDDKLVGVLQAADREVRSGAALREAGLSEGEVRAALSPEPLRVSTIEPVDDRRDSLGGLAFFTILILYGQLLTYGFWVASGVVEEKASRVVEILLSTIRPRELLAGKVIGLGLLGLAQLLLVAAVGLLVATATGAVDVDSDLLIAVGLSLLWFVLGYAFFACAFACAGALVPRLEELQASATPLTLTIMISLFIAFAVNSDPEGTLAHVSAFIPFTAPMTLPPRILVGAAPWYEVVGGAVVTLAAAAALIPLAARIYSGAVLRTGSAVKLRDAWRARSAA
ncbi:MAG TPA: ABC transporter permease [Solirubrobacteraceae bacterium]|nr:ABC transporter permease [Solirubrobacteraceae bacterium]